MTQARARGAAGFGLLEVILAAGLGTIVIAALMLIDSE